jgi:hypothetical protein
MLNGVYFCVGDRRQPHAPRRGYDEDGILSLTQIHFLSMGGPQCVHRKIAQEREQWTYHS